MSKRKKKAHRKFLYLNMLKCNDSHYMTAYKLHELVSVEKKII